LLVATLGLVYSPSPATAQSESGFTTPIRVEVLADASCSSADAFFEAVRKRSARVRAADAGEGAALLEVKLERAASGVRGDLKLHHEGGATSSRHVTGVSCEAVVDALSLTAALALDSAAAEGPAEPAPTSPAVDSTPPSASDAPAEASDPVVVRDSELENVRPELGAHAAVARLVAPHLHVGGALSIRLRLERQRLFSPSLGLSLLHTDNGLFESSRHVSLQVSGATLSLCPARVKPTPRLRLEPCLTGLGARLKARGRDLPDAREVTRSWWGAGAMARAAFELQAQLSVELEAGGLVPLVSRTFVVLPDETSLGATPALAPFANVGITYVL
jgi:hypothetical protein